MDMVWLSTFKKIADEGSYTRAAALLSISQPAVSKQVRQLEKIFGAKLIRVSGRELQLTEAGKQVYDFASRIEADFKVTHRKVETLAGLSRDVVTIACNTNTLVHQLPSILRQFWLDHPEITVRTLRKGRYEINDAVKSGLADLGIQTSPFLDKSLEAILSKHEPFIVVASREHALADTYTTTPEQISRERVVISSGEHGTLVDEWFAAHGTRLRDVMVVSCFEEARVATMENLGIGILPRDIVAEDLASGRLVQLCVDDFDPSRTTYVVYAKGIGPPASWLIDLLVQPDVEGKPGPSTLDRQLAAASLN
jgi:DNA-binding transcriptional LysR family regulator